MDTWVKEKVWSGGQGLLLTLPSALLPFLESTGDTVPLQRSQSLPHSATVTLSGTSDPHALAGSALSKRETSRLDKFKQLLAGPNTDLGESLRVGCCFLQDQKCHNWLHTRCIVFS